MRMLIPPSRVIAHFQEKTQSQWRLMKACGMNFAYSGQIMALNQYFYKRHSIATSMAMLGIGLGIFFLSSVTEHNIEEYGWRGSFIWSAGLSLQIVVFGSLIFPLQPVPEGKMTQHPKENIPEPSRPLKAIRTSKSRMLLGKSLNHRSFSSLRLSAEASYLGHSQLSLMDSQRHLSNVRSNQHSFCSKGSHLVIGSIRSNGHSFCTRDSHAELSHFDLRSNQFSFHHKDSFAEFGLHSNAHSFCSRRDSQAGLNGIKSNPHSFIHHHHVLDGEGDSLKGSCGGGRARFMLREGDCDLGCCVLEEEDDCLSEQSAGEEHQSVCLVMAGKVKHKICNSLRGLTRKSEDNLCINARFWLLDLAFFFAMLGTMCLFIIYKDFAVSKNVGEYYTMGLSGIGIGDLVGRMSAGLMLSSEFFNPLLMYGLTMFFCGLVVICHMLITTSTHFLVLATLFGILYGSQNVLIAVAPSKIFGREKLPSVFGYILFLGGLGALFGAPIAGSIVDSTGSFDGVLGFTSANLFVGSILLFICFLVHRSAVRPQTVQIQV